jgi:hypothetical protein
MVGNTAAALEAYQQFLTSWFEADADVPVLLQAREEYNRLRSRLAHHGTVQ